MQASLQRIIIKKGHKPVNTRAQSVLKKCETLEAVQNTEETVSSLGEHGVLAEEEEGEEECEEERVEVYDEDADPDDRMLAAWQRARKQSMMLQEGVAFQYDTAADVEEQEIADEGKYRLSKEVMFLVAAFVVLLTSGGLILGFGSIYSVLVR